MKENVASRKVQSNYNKTQGIVISKFKWSTREVQANYLTITYAWYLFLDFALVNLNVLRSYNWLSNMLWNLSIIDIHSKISTKSCYC